MGQKHCTVDVYFENTYDPWLEYTDILIGYETQLSTSAGTCTKICGLSFDTRATAGLTLPSLLMKTKPAFC